MIRNSTKIFKGIVANYYEQHYANKFETQIMYQQTFFIKHQ